MILNDSLDSERMREEVKGSKVINRRKGWVRWLFNSIRNSHMRSKYYKGIDLDEWEGYED